MAKNKIGLLRVGIGLVFVWTAHSIQAQTMPGMAAMENSVGFLSSGTSVEPKTTSEWSPMIHRTIGDSTLMFHANVFVNATQASGPRGHDKVFSTNWFMPMLERDFGRQSVTFRTMFSLEPATV